MSSIQRARLNFTLLMSLAMLSLVFILSLSGCATTPKKELPADANATEELSKLDASIDAGLANHYEVLAEKDFMKAIKYRDEAKENLNKGKESKKVLEPIAYADALMERAKMTADSRRGPVEGVLKAREAALSAGIRHTPLEKNLEKVDDDMRADANDFTNDFSAKEFSKAQSDYYHLELQAIQNRELAATEKLIHDA